MSADAGTLLVGLEVTGTPAADEPGGAAERWQVLTARGDRIADFRGFDNRTAAADGGSGPRRCARLNIAPAGAGLTAGGCIIRPPQPQSP